MDMDRAIKLLLPFGIVALIIAVVWVNSPNSNMVEFVPLKKRDEVTHQLVSAPEVVSPEFWRRLQVVLNFYSEKYNVDPDGKVLISRKLADNQELRWNYTNKAQDQTFIEETKKR